jgi:hypothetical protein
MNRRLFMSVVGAGAVALGVGIAEAKPGRVEKLIVLKGTGKGKARYRVDPSNKRNFMVEVENLKALKGQTLKVSVTSGPTTTQVGTITISALGAGKLELESQRGQSVPNILAGDKVSVSSDTTLVLSGTF